MEERGEEGEGRRARNEWEGGWGNDNGREDEERKWKEIGEGMGREERGKGGIGI